MQKRCTCRYSWEFIICLLVKRRDMVSENDICGEWNVVEIQGTGSGSIEPLYRIRYEERESIWI